MYSVDSTASQQPASLQLQDIEDTVRVRHSEGPPFRRSAIPKDRDETWIAGWSSLTLTLTLTLGNRNVRNGEQ